MIKVKIKNNHIEIKGHANYDEEGKDIVCASVSTIVITTINAMLRFDKESIKYEQKDGYISLDLLKSTKEIDILKQNMIELLKELEQDYKSNIKINEEVQ